MVKNWQLAAEFVEREFGAYVNWDERFFHCPECDWELHRWSMCPICEVPWEEICG